VSDAYSLNTDSSGPPLTDAERRRLLLQRLQQAANTTPGQTPIASAPAPGSALNADQPPPPAPGSMLQALREANALPCPAAASPNQPATEQPTAGFADRTRAYLHNQIDRAVDTSTGFDENGKPGALAQGILNAGKVGWSYVPGPQSDVATAIADSLADKQSIKGALHTSVDTALDPAARARAIGVARGVHQGLSGFNEGLGNVAFAPVDALDSGANYIVGKLAAAFGAAPPPPVTSVHDYYNRAFVAPAGPPQTKLEQQIRGASRSFGTDAPAYLLTGGLGAAGARSGVTLAEQMAPGLLEKIRPAANAVGRMVDPSNPTVREAAGFIATKLKDMVPNFINTLHPTNVANAVRASNVQGAADATLQQIAKRPRTVAFEDFARDWRTEKRRQAQEAAQQAHRTELTPAASGVKAHYGATTQQRPTAMNATGTGSGIISPPSGQSARRRTVAP
jgi:hypothetical protein